MTINTTHAYKQYNGNGSTTIFAVDFQFYDKTELAVTLVSALGVETVKTYITHYSVSGGAGSTGSVTMLTAPATGEKLRIERATAATQLKEWAQNDSFSEVSMNEGLDRRALYGQELALRVARSIKQGMTNFIAGSLVEFSFPAPEASKGIAWNANGDGLENVAIGGEVAQAAQDAADAAAASQSAAAASASSASTQASNASSSASDAAASAAAALVSENNAAASAATLVIDTDGTLAANSATRVPAQSAVVTYVTAAVAAAVASILDGVSSAFDTLAEIATELALKATKATTITAGSGLTGGGDLSANRTLAVGAGTGITVNADDVAIANTAVTPGSYTNTNLTVDQQGRITAASNGSGATAAAQSDQETATSTATFVSPGRQQYHPSAAKAWAKINAVGTLSVGYNISSVTDNGTGDYTLNFSVAFSSANYGICVCAVLGNSGNRPTFGSVSAATGPTTGATRVVVGQINSGDNAYTALDLDTFASFFGDQ